MFDGQVSLKTLSLLGDVIFGLVNNRCAFPQVTVFPFSILINRDRCLLGLVIPFDGLDPFDLR